MSRTTRPRKKRPLVVSRHGSYRFQSGMITANLLQRGLPMEDAFTISRALRDRLTGREEIDTDDLEALLVGLVREHLGQELAPKGRPVPPPMVASPEGSLPFSGGLLARRLITAGLELDEAFAFAGEIGQWVRRVAGGAEISQACLEDEVERRLNGSFGTAAARRWRLVCWIREAEIPVIIFIGGATGTGKSSLATELAYRLGVRRVTSTDIIRETMRTVLPADVVPGLHDHSFRGIVQGARALSNPRERVLAGFHQQAAQVAVGVRAVVRRAIREGTPMILEGTHLRPPFSQYVPPGARVWSVGLVLGVLDERRHRARFPQRAATQPLRGAEAYLEAFQSVRWIHDDLLSEADDTNAVVLSNEDMGQTLAAAVEFLSQARPVGAWPDPRLHSDPPELEMERTLLLILDGLGDAGNPALDGKTPLGAAKTPTLDMLAGSGGQGQIRTSLNEGKAAETDEGLLSLLGESLEGPRPGRGLLEAMGRGVPMPPGAIVFRGNLATLQPDGSLTDRRAGRIRAGVGDLLSTLREIRLSDGIIGHLYPGHEHRVVVMLQGVGLSAAVSDTDPGRRDAVQRIHPPRALDDSPEANRTASALRQLLVIAAGRLGRHPLNRARLARGLPPANCIITRGASRVQAPARPQHRGAALVSGCATALGVARLVGMEAATSAAMTGNLDTDLDAKFAAAAELLQDRSYCKNIDRYHE